MPKTSGPGLSSVGINKPSEIGDEAVAREWAETDGGPQVPTSPTRDEHHSNVAPLSQDEERQRIIDTILSQERACHQYEEHVLSCKQDTKNARAAWKEQQSLMRGMFAELSRFDEAHGIERGV